MDDDTPHLCMRLADALRALFLPFAATSVKQPGRCTQWFLPLRHS